MRWSVSQDIPDLERRLTELQSQINRLSLSLHLWHERQERLQPVEHRLNQLTEQYSEMVDRAAVTGDRHAQMLGELEHRLTDWSTVDTHARDGASARVVDLQRMIEQEWEALKRAHDEPVKQLREQAAALTEVCMTAATQAMSGFDRTEARLADMQTDFRDRLTVLSDQVQLAVAELRTLARPSAAAGGAASWPLDGVVRLHNQLRGADQNGVPSAPEPAAMPPQPEVRLLPEAGDALSQRVETLERALIEGQTELRAAAERSTRTTRLWWAAVVLLAIGVGGAAVIVNRLQRQVADATAQVAEAQQRAQAAAEAANRQIVAARQDAARQIDEARETAIKAQTISDVLAAPDLVRFSLVGRDHATAFSALALWSRSRGLVFSGSRLPAPPPDSTYQIWILTTTDPVSVGTFEPDGGGRFTMATTTPPRVPPPIAGLTVTVERVGGSDRPSGATLLARAE